MGWMRRLLAVLLLVAGLPVIGPGSLHSPPAQAQPSHTPFPCDTTYYAMQDGNPGDHLGRISFPPPGDPSGARFQSIHQAPFGWNAMGFDHTSGLIYGMAGVDDPDPGRPPAQVFRVGANGNFELLGVPRLNGVPWDEAGFPAGAILPGGRYAAIRGSGTHLYVINVDARPPNVTARRALTLANPGPGLLPPDFSDIAVNPIDDEIYGFDESNQRIARITRPPNQPDVALVTFVSPPLPAPEFQPNGSTWIDGQGRITLLGQRGSEAGQRTFLTAEFSNSNYDALQQIGNEPGLSQGSDGTNCAYRMTLDKTVSPATVQAGSTVTYSYRITNGTPGARIFSFQDALPADGRTFTGNITVNPSTGLPPTVTNGGRTLTIAGMQLAEDAAVTVTAQVRVPVTFPPGTVYNQAELFGINGGYPNVLSDFPGTANPADPTPLVVRPAPADLTIRKMGPAAVQVGETFNYTIFVQNNGPGPSPSSTVTDTIPDGLDLINAGGGTVSNGGRTVTWQLGRIDTGREWPPLTLGVRARNNPGTTVRNTATVAGGGGVPDPGPGPNSSTVDTRIDAEPVPTADLVVSKSVEGTPRPGQRFNFRISVQNTSSTTTSAASTVVDDIPAGFVPDRANASPQPVRGSGQQVIWDLAPIPPATTVTLVIPVTAPAQGGTATNRATLTPDPNGPADPNTGNNTGEVTVTVPAEADLVIAKAGPQAVRARETFEYLIRVTNNGPSTSGKFRVDDTIPAGFSPNRAAATPPAGGSGQEVTWVNQPELGPGESRNYVIPVTAPAEGGTATNSATVTPDPGGPVDNPDNNRSNVVTTRVDPVADLRITKQGPQTNPRPGQPFDYTVTVTNAGPSTSGTFSVVDDLPAGFTPNRAASTPQPVGGTGQRVEWTGQAALGPGLSRNYVIRVTAPAEGGTGRNTATVTPDPGGPADDPGNNTSNEVITPVAPEADLQITKQGPPTNPRPGQTFNYTMRVTNNGPSTSGNSTVTDNIPAGFTPDRAKTTPPPTRGTGNQLIWDLGPLAPGAFVDFVIPVTAPAEGGSGSNTATVERDPAGPTDPNDGNNTATTTPTTVTPEADLALRKDGPAFVEAGAPFDWVVTLTNAGPSTARNVTVTDTVPAGFTVGTPSDGGTAVPAPGGGPTVVTWVLGDVAPGTRTLTVPVTAPGTAGSGTNTVAVTTTTLDPVPGNNVPANSTVQVRGFTLAKSVSPQGTSVKPGDTLTYTIVATNPSSVAYTAEDPASFRDDLTDVIDDATVTALDPAAEITTDATGFTWRGPIPAGGSRTITVTVVVDSPTSDGNDSLANVVTGGTNCKAGSTDAACRTAALPVRELQLTKTVDTTVVAPGQTVTFTVEVTNTGGYAFTELDRAAVSDDLSGVLDDATFGSAATDPAGVGLFVPPVPPVTTTLAWSGPLDVGATVKLIYTVTVNNPQTGDGRLVNLVSSAEDPRCLPEEPCGPAETPLVKAFLLNKSVDAPATGVAPGDEVTYTITVTNSGQVAYSAEDPATFDDDLSGVVDDATIVEAASDVGDLEFNDDRTVFTWRGPLPVAEPPGTPGATITVTVRVKNPNLTGDHLMANVVSGSANCPPPDGSPTGGAECTAGEPLPVKGLTVAKDADVELVRAGGTVTYTITVTNTGEVDYTVEDPAVVVDDLAGVLDDADYNGDGEATNGEQVTFDAAAKTLTWSGPLPAGADPITITYSVTVHRPGDGDHLVRNVVTADDSNCPATPDEGVEPDPTCGAGDVPVAELRITKAADVGSMTPGGTVRYTVTVDNIGKVDYPAEPAEEPAVGPASWSDDLSAVLDDASYSGDANAGAGAVSYQQPVLRWEGPVAAGESVKITYSVRVNNPLSGDGAMRNVVTAPDSNCPCSTDTRAVARPAPGLPATGVEVGGLLRTGAALLLFGLAFLLVAARRRHHR